MALEEVLRQVPDEPQTTSLRHLATRVSRTVQTCQPAAEDVATAHSWLCRIATTLGYATAVTAATAAHPPLPARSSAQVRTEMEALLTAVPARTRYSPAQGAFVSAWRRLWRTWGPELLHCYDIPALPPDNLQLEGVFGCLRRHQRRISGVPSTHPLRDLGQFQVLFTAESEGELLAQLRTVPHAQYVAHRRRVAAAEADRQHRWRLHRDPAGTVAALLQQHAMRRGILATTAPSPAFIHTG
ncbi:MAG: hypothetical protein M3010_08640 [Candidatus Dormibacteraeota bacterium]|nr:hypothetical protein [Candidatus Dormibacteraeota bacterium]